MDRLTSIDASFLAQEREGSHMHIGGVLIFDGDAPSKEELAEHIEARLHLVPRYRQKLSFPRFEMGRPLWVDDPSFNIGYHVRHTALPAPGSGRAAAPAGRRASSPSASTAPSRCGSCGWSRATRAASSIVNKVHHAVVDGVSGADLTTVLFDLSKDGTDVPPPESAWSPAPEPSDAQVVAKGAGGPGGSAGGPGAARTRHRDRPEPGRWGARARWPRVSARSLWGTLNSAPETPLNGPIGPHRRVTWVRMPLAELKEIKNALGGTVNDVFLATVAGALHNWLRSRGMRTEGLEIRSAVPVSVRADGAGSELGNQITVMVGRLPTYVADPVERLRVVSESMKGLKESKQALGAQAIAGVEDFAPPTIFARASRLHFSNRMYNLLTTNVPGPQFPLYLLGREMSEMLPVAFLAPGQRLAIACMSYNGTRRALDDRRLRRDAGPREARVARDRGGRRAARRGRVGDNGRQALTRNSEERDLPYFKDADEVYEFIGKLFEDLADDEELGPKFRKANTIVQYQYSNPDSQITVKMIDGEDGQVDTGDTTLEPEVVMTMEADTAHKFWLGKVNVTVALARGQMKAKGPVAKILKLVPLVKPVFPRYRAMLEEKGRTDLVEA